MNEQKEDRLKRMKVERNVREANEGIERLKGKKEVNERMEKEIERGKRSE